MLADRAHKNDQILKLRAVLGQCAQYGTIQATLNEVDKGNKEPTGSPSAKSSNDPIEFNSCSPLIRLLAIDSRITEYIRARATLRREHTIAHLD